ncbi:isochorismate synthase [Kiritimatiellaeota bacterium B1221]|nr:isochorismate synthase [Kiritimatiellaeota bacterium B1221]
MPMRIRMAYKDWMNAPDQIQARGVRIEVSMDHVDPLRWLLAQRFHRRVYWSARDRDEVIAGVGCCHECSSGSIEEPERLFERGREVLAHFGTKKPMYLGGFSFTETSVDERPWPEMGKTRFWIPFAEVSRREGKTILACNLYFRRNVEVNLQQLLHEWQSVLSNIQTPEELPTLLCRRDFPEKDGWESNVSAALDLIENGVLDKVVLARKAEYTFAAEVPATWILAVLEQVTSNCYHFLIQPSETAAFMGTPPECLYRREGRRLNSEALAGTRPRVSDEEKDRQLGAELIASVKERHEQELVRRDLIRALHLLSVSVEAEEEPKLLKLERKQHLLSQLAATLQEMVSDADILKSLHPTPAVGGSPRVNALRELKRLEPFSRGWYAAPVGCFGEDFAEFAVAIRSGLVQGRQVNIYSGAGIVKGSDPAEEWQEIENKISDFVKVTSGRLL